MKLFLCIKNFLLNILFPINCIGCKLKNEILCENCISKIELAERETDENILAVFDYRNSLMKRIIWELKYHHKRYLGEKLGQLLYENLIEEISDLKILSGQSILVIPIPISINKSKKRGYNQASVIAKGFCNSAGPKVFELNNNILFKKIETIPQAKIINRKRRLQNVKGVFDIKNENKINGRFIIVIDDVTTTGSTINEVMKLLKKAKAKKVIGLAVAH